MTQCVLDCTRVWFSRLHQQRGAAGQRFNNNNDKDNDNDNNTDGNATRRIRTTGTKP